jgi:rRNA pseudouridine-1189 N-methylase Emg1 (Nep1/Mra1 family)
LVKEEKPMVVVGCFQAGDFREETLALADDVVAIAQTPLDAWVVVAKVLSSVEDELGLT